MSWFLTRYLNFWNVIFWPFRKVAEFCLGRADDVTIWLIGDI
jgi:hypothetical protein